MKENEVSLPCLVLQDSSVPFPDKGRNCFLSLDNLVVPTENSLDHSRPGLWLFRAESGVCGIIPVKARIIHRKALVAGMAVLHHGESIEIEGKSATFREVRRLALEQGNHLVGRPCPYCHARHDAGKTVLRCPLCGEPYCEDCWTELKHKRCCTRNCRFSPEPVKG